MRYLTFALGKGRLAKKTMETFEKIGITCEEMKDPDTRKLIFVNEELKLKFFHSQDPALHRVFCLPPESYLFPRYQYQLHRILRK